MVLTERHTETDVELQLKHSVLLNVYSDYLINAEDPPVLKEARQLFATRVLELMGDWRSWSEFANDVQRKTGEYPDSSWLYQIALRKATPTFDLLGVLAQYAGKPVSWFFEEGDE